MPTRVPRGYQPDHPGGKWLRNKSFTLGRVGTDAQAVIERLPQLLESDFTLMLSLVHWRNIALGLRSATRR